jgi:hypothetical protein
MRIRLEHIVLHRNYEVLGTTNPAELTIDHLEKGQGGRYVLWVNPDRYRSMFRIIRISDCEENEEHIVLAIDPKSVKEVRFPKYEELSLALTDVLAQSSFEPFKKLRGKHLYEALDFDQPKKAALFNLFAKLNATIFHNGRTAFSYFDKVGGTLDVPSSAFELVDSFNTPELYGNLHLTFSCRPETLELFVEATIDDAGGIQSIFQVADHKLAHSVTHPYDIHQILLHYQKINPGYALVV